MLKSLFSGVAGLQAHQTKMDVIGNNISNVNTAGYKASRVAFKDVYYQTLASGNNPTGTAGGTNSRQVGYGTQVGSINVLHTNTGYQNTGKPTDCYIGGDGYFVVQDPSGNEYYKRLGDLQFDQAGNLTDTNGNFVCGYPTVRNGNSLDFVNVPPVGAVGTLGKGAIDFGPQLGSALNGFKIEVKLDKDKANVGAVLNPSKNTITITMQEEDALATPPVKAPTYNDLLTQLQAMTLAPIDAKDPTKLQGLVVPGVGTITDSGVLKGLLSDIKITSTDEVNKVLAKGSTFSWGNGNIDLGALLGSTFNGININIANGIEHSTTSSSVFNPTAKTLTVTLPPIDPTSVPPVTTQNFDDLVAALKKTILAVGEKVQVGTKTYGPIVNIGDADNIAFTALFAGVKVASKDPAITDANLGLEKVFGAPNGGTAGNNALMNGGVTTITTAELLASGVHDVTIGGFDPKDTAATAGGISASTGQTHVDATKKPTHIKLPGELLDTNGDGLVDKEEPTQPSNVGNITIGADGTITGIVSTTGSGGAAANQQTIILGQIALAKIPNPEGLTLVGNSYFQARTNAGKVQYTIPGSDNSGQLTTSALEASNVDLSNEFSDMIITERGFQANSRIITVSDEMLQELVNLKR